MLESVILLIVGNLIDESFILALNFIDWVIWWPNESNYYELYPNSLSNFELFKVGDSTMSLSLMFLCCFVYLPEGLPNLTLLQMCLVLVTEPPFWGSPRILFICFYVSIMESCPLLLAILIWENLFLSFFAFEISYSFVWVNLTLLSLGENKFRVSNLLMETSESRCESFIIFSIEFSWVYGACNPVPLPATKSPSLLKLWRLLLEGVKSKTFFFFLKFPFFKLDDSTFINIGFCRARTSRGDGFLFLS